MKSQTHTKGRIRVAQPKRKPLSVRYAELLRLRAAIQQALSEKATSRDRRQSE
jgi:hypothetical protein